MGQDCACKYGSGHLCAGKDVEIHPDECFGSRESDSTWFASVLGRKGWGCRVLSWGRLGVSSLGLYDEPFCKVGRSRGGF